MRALVVQHVALEDLDGFARALAERNVEVEYCFAGSSALPEELPHGDMLFVLGGPIGVDEVDVYPALRRELGLIERQLARGGPLLGICLGAKLIAKVLGARVGPGPGKEIGFAPIELADSGSASCLGALEEDRVVLHWHGDVFEIPEGATRLASDRKA